MQDGAFGRCVMDATLRALECVDNIDVSGAQATRRESVSSHELLSKGDVANPMLAGLASNSGGGELATPMSASPSCSASFSSGHESTAAEATELVLKSLILKLVLQGKHRIVTDNDAMLLELAIRHLSRHAANWNCRDHGLQYRTLQRGRCDHSRSQQFS